MKACTSLIHKEEKWEASHLYHLSLQPLCLLVAAITEFPTSPPEISQICTSIGTVLAYMVIHNNYKDTHTHTHKWQHVGILPSTWLLSLTKRGYLGD